MAKTKAYKAANATVKVENAAGCSYCHRPQGEFHTATCRAMPGAQERTLPRLGANGHHRGNGNGITHRKGSRWLLINLRTMKMESVEMVGGGGGFYTVKVK